MTQQPYQSAPPPQGSPTPYAAPPTPMAPPQTSAAQTGASAQAGTAAPPAGSAPANGTAQISASTSSAKPSDKRRFRWTTPHYIRAAMVAGVIAALVTGVTGWQAGNQQSGAVADVLTSSDRLVAVQEVRNSLVAADSIATNAFLVGGLEPAGDRADYTAAINEAAKSLASLQFSTAEQTNRLADATSALTQYTGLVEQARAANRQGLPVGSAYLDQASTLLRQELLPALDDLTSTGADEVAGDFRRVSLAPWWTLALLVGLGLLLYVQWWDARRTHRRLNFGLMVATVSGITAAVLSIGLALVSATTANTRQESYRTTLAVSLATASAYDARSMESFTLIRRGSGAAYEEAFQVAAADSQQQLKRVEGTDVSTSTALFEQWLNAHTEIRALDDGGDWDGAVAAAISTDPGSASAIFAEFAADSQTAMSTAHDQMTSQLKAARLWAAVLGWLILLAGIVGALGAWRGLAVRLEEYR